MKERRKHHPKPQKSSSLPSDFLKMVGEVFANNFSEGLKRIRKVHADSAFIARGEIYPDEIVLSVSLIHPGQLQATSVYASADFDPKASSPTLEDLMAACVDASGTVFGLFFDSKHPERVDQLLEGTMAAIEDVPYEWTEVTVEKRRIFVMLDKSNPTLDEAADDWLAKHDPTHAEREAREHEETEGMFVTGATARKK